jgi:hypothetical protein
MLVAKRLVVVIFLIAVTASARRGGFGLGAERREDVRSILERRVIYEPEGKTPLEQIINIGRRFHIPMGIEWIDDGEASALRKSTNARRGTSVPLRDLIRSTLRTEGGYTLTVQDNLVRIYKPVHVRDPRNFLNIRIPEFAVNDANLLEAEQLLRFKIQAVMYPEERYGGQGGGYGHAPGSVFAVNNITLSESNATVRQILDAITTANGNAIWVVHLVPSKTKPGERYFVQDQWPTPGFHWLFIPLDKNGSGL